MIDRPSSRVQFDVPSRRSSNLKKPNEQIYEMSQYQNGTTVPNGDVVVSFNNMMTRNALVQTVESNRTRKVAAQQSSSGGSGGGVTMNSSNYIVVLIILVILLAFSIGKGITFSSLLLTTSFF